MNKIKDFFRSYNAICVILVLVCVVMFIFNLYIMNETRIYVFGGYEDGITIMDGTIFTSIKTNRFSAPSISYTKDNYVLKEYKIGYFLGDDEISVITNESNDLSDVSLIELLQNTEFSFTETHNGAMYFNHKNLKNIDNLTFKIIGKTTSDEDISINVTLNVTKIN